MVEMQEISAYLSVSVDCVTLIGIFLHEFPEFSTKSHFHDSAGLRFITLGLHIVRP